MGVMVMWVLARGPESEWWMKPGEYWSGDGDVCREHYYDSGHLASVTCRSEPILSEKLWDWNWAHIVEPSFPAVWAVLLVLVFIGTAVYFGLNKSEVIDHDCWGLWSILAVLFFGLGGALWEAYIALGLVAGVWGGIFWLTSAGGLAAVRARQARAQKKRVELIGRAEAWDAVAESMADEDEVNYRKAAQELAAGLREQARMVR